MTNISKGAESNGFVCWVRFQTSLVENHVERILSLESALRQRDNSLQKLNIQLHSKDMQYLQLHAGPDTHSE